MFIEQYQAYNVVYVFKTHRIELQRNVLLRKYPHVFSIISLSETIQIVIIAIESCCSGFVHRLGSNRMRIVLYGLVYYIYARGFV